MAGDQTILSGSVRDADVKAVLGAGDVTNSTQSGSFVVPTQGKVVGTHHRYRNGNVTSAFWVRKNNVCVASRPTSRSTGPMTAMEQKSKRQVMAGWVTVMAVNGVPLSSRRWK